MRPPLTEARASPTRADTDRSDDDKAARNLLQYNYSGGASTIFDFLGDSAATPSTTTRPVAAVPLTDTRRAELDAALAGAAGMRLARVAGPLLHRFARRLAHQRRLASRAALGAAPLRCDGAALAALEAHPYWALLPRTALELLVRTRGIDRVFAPGEVLRWCGEPAEATGVVLVVRGQVRVEGWPSCAAARRNCGVRPDVRTVAAPLAIGAAAAFTGEPSRERIWVPAEESDDDGGETEGRGRGGGEVVEAVLIPFADAVEAIARATAAAASDVVIEARQRVVAEHFPLSAHFFGRLWIAPDLSAAQCRQLAVLFVPRSFAPGSTLCRRGAARDDDAAVLVVRRGGVRVWRSGECSAAGAAVLRGGGCAIGEMGAVLGGAWDVNVQAELGGFVDCWVLPRPALEHFLGANSDAAARWFWRAARLRCGWLWWHRAALRDGLVAGALLRALPLLAALPAAAMAELVDAARPRVFVARAAAASTSSQCGELLVIASGTVALQQGRRFGGALALQDNRHPHRCAILRRGDVLGERCVVPHRWPHAACCTTRVDAWAVPRQVLVAVLAQHGLLASATRDAALSLQQELAALGLPPLPRALAAPAVEAPAATLRAPRAGCITASASAAAGSGSGREGWVDLSGPSGSRSPRVRLPPSPPGKGAAGPRRPTARHGSSAGASAQPGPSLHRPSRLQVGAQPHLIRPGSPSASSEAGGGRAAEQHQQRSNSPPFIAVSFGRAGAAAPQREERGGDGEGKEGHALLLASSPDVSGGATRTPAAPQREEQQEVRRRAEAERVVCELLAAVPDARHVEFRCIRPLLQPPLVERYERRCAELLHGPSPPRADTHGTTTTTDPEAAAPAAAGVQELVEGLPCGTPPAGALHRLLLHHSHSHSDSPRAMPTKPPFPPTAAVAATRPSLAHRRPVLVHRLSAVYFVVEIAEALGHMAPSLVMLLERRGGCEWLLDGSEPAPGTMVIIDAAAAVPRPPPLGQPNPSRSAAATVGTRPRARNRRVEQMSPMEAATRAVSRALGVREQQEGSPVDPHSYDPLLPRRVEAQSEQRYQLWLKAQRQRERERQRRRRPQAGEDADSSGSGSDSAGSAAATLMRRKTVVPGRNPLAGWEAAQARNGEPAVRSMRDQLRGARPPQPSQHLGCPSQDVVDEILRGNAELVRRLVEAESHRARRRLKGADDHHSALAIARVERREEAAGECRNFLAEALASENAAQRGDEGGTGAETFDVLDRQQAMSSARAPLIPALLPPPPPPPSREAASAALREAQVRRLLALDPMTRAAVVRELKRHHAAITTGTSAAPQRLRRPHGGGGALPQLQEGPVLTIEDFVRGGSEGESGESSDEDRRTRSVARGRRTASFAQSARRSTFLPFPSGYTHFMATFDAALRRIELSNNAATMRTELQLGVERTLSTSYSVHSSECTSTCSDDATTREVPARDDPCYIAPSLRSEPKSSSISSLRGGGAPAVVHLQGRQPERANASTRLRSFIVI